jgi:hypothetical protein
MSLPALSIRLATATDADALARLAQLDHRVHPSGRALIAEHDGTPIAAVALTSGAVVADPAHRAGGVVEQLRFRRYQLLAQGGQVARLSFRRSGRPVSV